MSTDLKSAQERSRHPSALQATDDLNEYERDLMRRMFSSVLLIPGRFRDWMQATNEDIFLRADDTKRISRASVPVGAEVQYTGTVIPSGFLPSNGAAVSRKTYASLFAQIGTASGAGDGSTTFNVPNHPGFIIQT
jgi:hypothetical protein